MEHEVYEHKLKEGPKGLVVHVPGSRVVSLSINFNSGFQFGDLGCYEIPHVLEHLLFVGKTQNYPHHHQLAIEIAKNGAFNNAYTSDAYNRYVSEFAQFETERIIGLQQEVFTRTLFDNEDIRAEVNNVRQELTRNTTEYGRQASLLYAVKGWPKRYMMFEDRLAQLGDITHERLVAYYRQSHTRHNMRFFVAGDFDDNGHAVAKAVGQALADLPSGQRRLPDWKMSPGFAPAVMRRDIDQLYYCIGWFSPALPDELRPAAVILRSLVSEGFGSRIYGKARHLGLVYHVSCAVDYNPESSELAFYGYVTSDNIKPLFELIASEMKDIAAGHLNAQDLEATKNLRTGSQTRAYQTAGQILAWYMDRYEEDESIEGFDGWIAKLQSVTVDQVVAVAKRLLDTSAHGASFVGPLSEAQAESYIGYLGDLWK